MDRLTSTPTNPPIPATIGEPSNAGEGSRRQTVSALQLLNLTYIATYDMLDAMRPELPELMNAQEFTQDTPDADFSEKGQSPEEFASGLVNALQAEEEDEAEAADAIYAAPMATGMESVLESLRHHWTLCQRHGAER